MSVPIFFFFSKNRKDFKLFYKHTESTVITLFKSSTMGFYLFVKRLPANCLHCKVFERRCGFESFSELSSFCISFFIKNYRPVKP